MKKYFILPLSLIATSLFAQFSINGQIENYSNQPVLIKLFENGNSKTIVTAKTDATGNFSAKVPVQYNGIIKIETPSGSALNLISENENIKFKTTQGENIQTALEVIEGKSQKEYNNLQKLSPLNDLNANVLPHIKKMYQANDPFFKAIEAEQKRIENANKNVPITSNLVQYIQTLEKLVQEVKANPNEQNSALILQRIQNDDERLEQSSYLPELVFGFINYQFSKAPNESSEANLQTATEILLEKGNIETERGQNILSTIFSLVPETNFPNFYKNYSTKVNSLTCKVTDDLKAKVNGSKTLKIGDTAPNIAFDSPIKGKKNLFDIKANQKLVVFWASWCPACNKEMPYIKEYYNDFKKNDGEIVAISLDYNQKDFDNATKDLPWYNYTDLLRWDSPVADKFNIQSTPTLILLDKDNKIVQIVNHVTELKK